MVFRRVSGTMLGSGASGPQTSAVDAGLDDADALDGHAVRRERARRPLARADHARHERERGAFRRLEQPRFGRIEAGLERERMMDQRDDGQALRLGVEHSLEPREREAVDHDDAVAVE